jgi:hypothetical protein
VLRGGVDAWLAAGFTAQPLADPDAPTPIAWMPFTPEAQAAATSAAPASESLFLPRIAGQAFLEGRTLPLRQEMVVGFVDMVGSTRLVFERSAEEILEVMQAFMEVVHARRENPELAREFGLREGAALHLDPELRSLRVHVAPLREDR